MSRLADLAQQLVKPATAVATGWPRVRDTCNNLGWRFDEWQDDLGRLILAKDASGLYASSLCAISLPRQVGKTYLVGCIVFALCLTKPGTTVIWTAHRGRTATETFRSMKAKAKTPELGAFIDQRVKGGGIRSSNGEQEIEFLNGSRILFGAREAGFGVGFADVNVLVLDEVQRATVKAMDDLLPTTNAAENPLVLCMGTPPRPTDDGEVFTMLRSEAISGESDDVLYVELGAGERFDLSNEDEFWRRLRNVNPSFPHRVDERAILRNKKGLTEDSVFREVFGIWDDVGEVLRVVPSDIWNALVATETDMPAQDVPPSALGVDMFHDRVSSVAGCWLNGDKAHVEILALDVAHDTKPVEDWIVERAGRKIPVVIASDSPAASMIPALKARKVRVLVVSGGADMIKACGGWFDDVIAGRLTHAGQPELDDALAGAKKRRVGDAGGWGWDRKDPATNISPLVSVTNARFGAVVTKKPPRTNGRNSSEGRRAVLI